MRNILSLLMFLLFFKPFSAIAYVFAVTFTGLVCVSHIKRKLTSLDIAITSISVLGSCLSVLNVSHVLATSGILAAIFYISFYPIVIFVVLLDVDHEALIRRLFGLILTFGIPILLISAILMGPASHTFNGYSTVPNLIGIQVNRFFFPFTGGVNHFGIILGFCLVATSALKLNYFQGFSWCFGVLVLFIYVDSRGAVLGVIAALLFSKWKFIPPFIWIITPLVIVALGLFLLSVADFNFGRENSTLFSQREYLWALGISGLSSMTWLNLFMGYGSNGFMSNDIAVAVSDFFTYRNNIGSLHNAHLTLLYDYGLLGLILVITIQFKIITNLKYCTDEWRNFVLRCLIYLSITSATETIYSFNYVFILFSFIFISKRKSKNTALRRKF